MRRRTTIRLPDGTVRELRDGEIVPDGAIMTVPIMLKDGAADADADAFRDEARAVIAHAAMVRAIADGWKDARDAEPPPADREEAYEAMKRRIADAWMQPEPRR